MNGYATLFWQFDATEFARMHQAENEYRRTWLGKKIAKCQKELAEGILSTKVRTQVLEDMIMFEDILKAMYGDKEVSNGN